VNRTESHWSIRSDPIINAPRSSKTMSIGISYSVITICKNSDRTIGRTIDSVLRQDPLPLEYVFVDGGSTDETRRIIEERDKEFNTPRRLCQFLILNQEGSRGITQAWNIGLAHCKGDVIFILNSDDWYQDDTASTVLEAFYADREAELVVGNVAKFLRGGNSLLGTDRNRALWFGHIMMPINHPACFVRRSVYERIGCFDTRFEYAADYDFILRCYKKRFRFLVIEKRLTNFELGGAANSHRREARMEVYMIGRKYFRFSPLPLMAFLIRYITRR